MSQPCNISNSSRPWGSSDEIDAITDACSNHTRDCVKTCQFPETVKAKAGEIGTITHIAQGTYAYIYHWKPSQSAIPECAIRVVKDEKTPIIQKAIARTHLAQKKLKNSVFALPVYYQKDHISFMPLLKVENHLLKVIPKGGLSFYEFSDFLQELFQALRDLKKEDLVHADLSPLNCNWDPKACRRFTHFDYDLTDSPDQLKKYQYALVCFWYRSPEIWNLQRDLYNYSIDMWSAGCLAYRALTGSYLFTHSSEDKITAFQDFAYHLKLSRTLKTSLMARNVRESVKGKKDLSIFIADCKAEQLSDLMSQMLKIKPEERITPEAALQHDFFRAPDKMEEFAESFPTHISALINEYSQGDLRN